MSESGSNQGQSQGRFQNGVWLSKAEGARSEKFLKWTDDHTKSKVETLDKQEHSSLVKLNVECLQVRTELRSLQQDRHHLSRDRPGSSEGPDSLAKPISLSSTSDASGMRVRKTSSSNNLTSLSSSGFPSLGSVSKSSSSSSSSPSFGRKISVKEGVWGGGEAGGARGKGVNPNASTQKLKNIHSSRALSKLMNNMDFNN